MKRGLSAKESVRRVLHSVLCAALRLRAGRHSFPGAGGILVIAPHPDDETLGCGALISRHRLQGDSVHVLYVTDGEAAFPDSRSLGPAALASMRRAEARDAMRILGVDQAEMTFLSVPDGTLKDLSPGAAGAVESRIAAVMDRLKPAELLLPCRRDGSSEHEAAFRLVAGALAQSGLHPRVLQYPVWASWSPRRFLHLLAARRVWRVGREGFWAVKRSAIAAYTSQIRGVPPDNAPVLSAEFLAFFSGEEEFFFEDWTDPFP
jgi:LmbE family N-acetylglucosaminyl deacetylase